MKYYAIRESWPITNPRNLFMYNSLMKTDKKWIFAERNSRYAGYAHLLILIVWLVVVGLLKEGNRIFLILVVFTIVINKKKPGKKLSIYFIVLYTRKSVSRKVSITWLWISVLFGDDCMTEDQVDNKEIISKDALFFLLLFWLFRWT